MGKTLLRSDTGYQQISSRGEKMQASFVATLSGFLLLVGCATQAPNNAEERRLRTVELVTNAMASSLSIQQALALQQISKPPGNAPENIFGELRFASLSGSHDGIALDPKELNLAIQQAVRSAKLLSQGSGSLGDSTKSFEAINWLIAESNDGQITTSWRRVPGRRAGVLLWKKDYETEVRHVITIRRSLNQPELTSYSVMTETRERPNDSYQWEVASTEYGRSSFEEMMQSIAVNVFAQILAKRMELK